MLYAEVNVPLEIPFAGNARKPAYADTDVEVVVSGPSGFAATVPAFWQGENRFGVRIAAPAPGKYSYTTTSTETSDSGLHGRTGEIEVVPYSGSNPLYRHGRLRVSANKRHLEQADGTPFFWLADTWWMGLCKRLSWPDDFKALTRDRVAKGFSVVHIIAGLYPDMSAFDERGANEAGFPWDREYRALKRHGTPHRSSLRRCQRRLAHSHRHEAMAAHAHLQGLAPGARGVSR